MANDSQSESGGVVSSTAWLGRKHATRWLDGEISMGKLLQLEGVPYAQGSSLLGGLWQALHEKAYALDAELGAGIAKCDKDIDEAMERGWDKDVIAEHARKRVLGECRSKLRFHLLGCIDNTGAAV